jgi:hypothetical protein
MDLQGACRTTVANSVKLEAKLAARTAAVRDRVMTSARPDGAVSQLLLKFDAMHCQFDVRAPTWHIDSSKTLALVHTRAHAHIHMHIHMHIHTYTHNGHH